MYLWNSCFYFSGPRGENAASQLGLEVVSSTRQLGPDMESQPTADAGLARLCTGPYGPPIQQVPPTQEIFVEFTRSVEKSKVASLRRTQTCSSSSLLSCRSTNTRRLSRSIGHRNPHMLAAAFTPSPVEIMHRDRDKAGRLHSTPQDRRRVRDQRSALGHGIPRRFYGSTRSRSSRE